MRDSYNTTFVNITFKTFLVLSGAFAFTIYIPYAIVHKTMGFNQYNMDYYRSIVVFSLVVAFYSLVICFVLLISCFLTKYKFKPVYFYLCLLNLLIFLTITYFDPGGVINWILD